MASNQPTKAIDVIPNDTINIPEPGSYLGGTNTGAGTTLTAVGTLFLDGQTNPAEKEKAMTYSIVDQATADLPELLSKKEKKLKKNIHPKWNSSDLVHKGMKKFKKTLRDEPWEQVGGSSIMDLAFLK